MKGKLDGLVAGGAVATGSITDFTLFSGRAGGGDQRRLQGRAEVRSRVSLEYTDADRVLGTWTNPHSCIFDSDPRCRSGTW